MAIAWIVKSRVIVAMPVRVAVKRPRDLKMPRALCRLCPVTHVTYIVCSRLVGTAWHIAPLLLPCVYFRLMLYKEHVENNYP